MGESAHAGMAKMCVWHQKYSWHGCLLSLIYSKSHQVAAGSIHNTHSMTLCVVKSATNTKSKHPNAHHQLRLSIDRSIMYYITWRQNLYALLAIKLLPIMSEGTARCSRPLKRSPCIACLDRTSHDPVTSRAAEAPGGSLPWQLGFGVLSHTPSLMMILTYCWHDTEISSRNQDL